MTVLSRALIRKMIIQEMRLSAPNRIFKPKLSSGLSFDDDEKTLDIKDDTEIDEVPSFIIDDEYTDLFFPEDEETEIDFDADDAAFGFDDDYDDDDFEFESETEEDSESETEYNPGRQIMDMSRDEIRKHVTAMADKLAPDMRTRDRRTRAQMQYDDLVRQGREAEAPDPEFLDTAELPPYEQRKKDMREHVSKRIRQSIRRQILRL